MLGASGYIGKVLLDTNQNATEFVAVQHREKSDYRKYSSRISTIVNLSSSSFSADEKEAWEANYHYQKEIITSFSSDKLKWIQVASYYELQIPQGRTDFYSRTKLAFRDFLTDFTSKHPNISATTVILPHVFGGNELQSRLIPTIQKMILGESVQFGSLDQMIPLMHVRDAAAALLFAINSDQKLCTAKPIWEGSLGSLLEVLLPNEENLHSAKFARISEIYKSTAIEFPEYLEGFEPQYKISNLVNDLRLGHLI